MQETSFFHHFRFYDQVKFHVQLSWAWKKVLQYSPIYLKVLKTRIFTQVRSFNTNSYWLHYLCSMSFQDSSSFSAISFNLALFPKNNARSVARIQFRTSLSIWNKWKKKKKNSFARWTFLVLQQQQNLGRRFGTSKMYLSPQWLRLLSVLRRWFCCCWLFVYCYSHCGSLLLFFVLLYVTLCPF